MRGEVIAPIAIAVSAPHQGRPTVAVHLGRTAEACPAAAPRPGPSERVLSLYLSQLDARGFEVPPQGPGLYEVGIVCTPANPRGAVAEYVSYDLACGEEHFLQGASGSVTLDAIDLAPGGVLSGTIDVKLASGDEVRGRFRAPVCAPTAAADAGTCH